MYYNELTEYERHRFNENPRCIYCGEEIKRTEDFTFAKTRVGRTIVYSLLHNRCVLDAREWVKRKVDSLHDKDTREWVKRKVDDLYGKDEIRV